MPARLTGPPCPVCVEEGVTPPHEAQAGGLPCRQHELRARLIGGRFSEAQAWTMAEQVIADAEAAALEAWLNAADGVEREMRARLTIREAAERSERRMADWGPPTSWGEVARHLGLDEASFAWMMTILTGEALAQFRVVVERMEQGGPEQFAQAMLAGLVLSAFVLGLELGRGGG